jgi:hypothetical protein
MMNLSPSDPVDPSAAAVLDELNRDLNEADYGQDSDSLSVPRETLRRVMMVLRRFAEMADGE